VKLLGFSRFRLLWKIVMSTSVAVTVLFALVGWIVMSNVVSTTTRSMEDEVQASFHAYQSLWNARSDSLASISRVVSAMSDVRGAFKTRDQATIRDTAGELWSKVSDENAIFIVTEPNGRVLASLGGTPGGAIPRELAIVPAAVKHFPDQVKGFWMSEGRLYQVAVTPVYVQSSAEPLLLDVLVAGFVVDHLVASRLKEATGGSEFLFLSGGQVIASTLNPRATAAVAASVANRKSLERVSEGVIEYSPLIDPLQDIDGRQIGKLCILRSFEAAGERLKTLQRNIILLWLFAMAVGVGLTYLLAGMIVRPLSDLDRAAAAVARQNYNCEVEVSSEDEIGRLARTFNTMCASIRNARDELIRQERISTIARLSSSIVHDLRNPLAAIYGGAEMLVDSELTPAQMKRLAGNIYRSSRRIQELLQDLLNISRGKVEQPEVCRLHEVVAAAADSVAPPAASQGVTIEIDIPEAIEAAMARDRMERVFLNLIDNALEVMPDGGVIRITASVERGSVLVSITDTGPGIAPEIRGRLFQPFVTAGKKNGLGLGLAMSRQTVLDHGGDLWAEAAPRQGACFKLRLPLAGSAVDLPVGAGAAGSTVRSS
jgi:signal transduction histidine kinase